MLVGKYMKIPKEDQAITFSDWGYLAVAKHFGKTLKHETAVLDDKDPEELHQMRVGMRRLRSALLGFNAALIFPQEINQKKVGKIASILGNLRDIDVLLDTLENQYKPNLPDGEQNILNVALKTLNKNRKHIFFEVEKTLHGQQYKQIKKGFKKWLKFPKYEAIGAINIKQILPDLLLPQISNFFLHQAWLVGTDCEEYHLKIRENLTQKEVESLLVSEGEKLHDLRKEAKRVRYNLELFTQFYGTDYQEYVDQVKDIQTVLGDLQDSFVLTEFLEDIFHTELEEKLPTLMNNFAINRYQKWQEWQILQTYFLNLTNRNKFREVVTIQADQIITSMAFPEEMG
jgi:CHAD domain-containing protein